MAEYLAPWLPDLWFALVFVLLGTFLFLDGFDFGVGMLFAVRPDDRHLLLSAIGPFWDGNEVWLVVFGGSLFAAFPAAYAGLFGRHYLLLFAVLAALVLRGLSPELFEQRDDEAWQRWWGRAFVAGSALAPFLLGAFAANWVTGNAGFGVVAFLAGLAVAALSLVEGTAFLALKTRGERRADYASLVPRAVAAYLVLVVATLGALYAFEPGLRSDLLAALPVGFVALSVLAAVVLVVATRRERHLVGMGAGGVLAYGLVGALASLTHPFVDPGAGLRVTAAAVPPLSLNLMTGAAAILLPLVVVYFVVLYGAFRGSAEDWEAY